MAIFQQGSFTLDANETPQSIAKKRQMIAELMMPYGRASNIGEGIGQLFNGIGVGMKNRQADKAEKTGMAQGATARENLYSMLSGGMSQPTPQQAPMSPNSGYEAGAVKRDPLPQGDVAKRIYDGLVTRGLPQHVAVGALGNNQVESQLDPGINETNPLVAGSRGGYGINQWTGPRRREFEAYAASVGKPASDLDTQLDFTMKELRGTESGAMAKLMQTKTPEEAARVYSESFLRPGIPHLDKRIAAAQQYSGFMNGDNQGQQAIEAQAPMQQPQMQPQAPQSDLQSMGLGGGTLQGDFPQAPQGQQMAQAQPQQGGMDMRMLMEAANNPWLDEGSRTFASQMLQREMQKSDPAYQMQQQNAQMELQKNQLQLEQMRNPSPEYETITGKDGSIFRVNKAGGPMETLYGAQPDAPKPTDDIQEYEYAKGQGFQGSFQDFQIAAKRAGASQVNIDQKAEGAFDKKLAEGQAEAFNTMAQEGLNARADLAIIGELDGLLKGSGGTLSGLSGVAAKYGIGGEGASDIQAAQALINKLVPTQRQAGSGSMSDRDVELFTRSLPSLWNSPGGNEKIINVMRGLASYKQAQGEIADQILMGEMSRQEGRKALRALPNPIADFAKETAAPVQQSNTPKRLKFNPATGELE